MADTGVFVSEFERSISNIDTAYPFIKPATVAGNPLSFSHLFADAVVSVSGLHGSVSLTSLSSAESGAKVSLVGDDGSAVSFSGGVAVDYGVWRVLSWSSLRGSVRFTLLHARVASFAWPASPKEAVFAPYALQSEARGLTGVFAAGQRLDGDITLRLGYNMERSFEPGTSQARGGSGMVLSATPGSGEGVAPCEDACPPTVLTINKVSPNGENDFSLTGEDCYVVLPDLVSSQHIENGAVVRDYVAENAVVVFGNNCSPCCDCDDYGMVYSELMTPMMEKGHELAARYQELLNRYANMLERIKTLAACKGRPEVKLVVTPGHNRSVYVAVGFFNNSETLWPSFPQAVHVGFESLSGISCRVVDEAVWMDDAKGHNRYNAVVTENGVTVVLHPVKCCSTVWISFSLVWDGSGAPVQYTVSMSGALDDILYNERSSGFTLPPVNRNR